jgi:hypothetical protein
MKNPSVKYIRTKPELTGEICIHRSCGCITAKATKPVGQSGLLTRIYTYIYIIPNTPLYRDESQLNKQWVFVEIFSS